jgi:hypothetical protein
MRDQHYLLQEHNLTTSGNINNKMYPTVLTSDCNLNYRKTEHDAIRKLFPEAEFVTIQGAGHWVHSDQPAEFIQIVGSFLSRPSCQ